MHDETEIIRAGDWRAIMGRADYADMPDGDGYPIIFRLERGRHAYGVPDVSVLAAPYDLGRHAGQLAERIHAAYYGAEMYDVPAAPWDAVETALLRAGAVDWHTFSYSWAYADTEYLAVVDVETLAAWGHTPETGAELERPAETGAADWQAWLDGDVYAVTVERRDVPDVCTIRRGWLTGAAVCISCAADCDCYGCTHEAETWETVESVGGCYGETWARDAAREMLETYAGETVETPESVR